MKKLLSLLTAVLITGSLSAKKVKFAVDMTGQTVSANGVHVTGDFQAAAGLGANWDPATAPLVKEGNTNIYSLVVNLPAFKKYEFRFVNGDLSYEAEFVPDESRVGYNFVDNRWLNVDSLANDTTFAGAVLFGGNAPSGKYLVRYKVSTNHLGVIPAAGFHVAGSFQGFDPTKIKLYSFGDGTYEIIGYVTAGTYQYKFYNGNTTATGESLPTSCSTSGNRSIVVSKDTVLAEVCFSECLACTDVGIAENDVLAPNFSIYPNPASGQVSVSTGLSGNYGLSLLDYTGKQVLSQSASGNATLDVSSLPKGIYFVRVSGGAGFELSKKLLVN